MGTLHCALEIGADLYVNERQKIRDYRARSTEQKKEEERRMTNSDFLLRAVTGAYVNLRYNYSDVIHSFDWKSAIERDGAYLARDIPAFVMYGIAFTENLAHPHL